MRQRMRSVEEIKMAGAAWITESELGALCNIAQAAMAWNAHPDLGHAFDRCCRDLRDSVRALIRLLEATAKTDDANSAISAHLPQEPT